MIKLLKKIWHYFKCSILFKWEMSNSGKRKFREFGKGSVINLPEKLISGQEYIKIGENTTILKLSRLQCYTFDEKVTASITIGNRCYIGFCFTALSAQGGNITIGDDVLIASDVLITNENHGMDPESEIPYMNQPLTVKSVKIEDGCWIGEKVCIMPGVNVGKKSIIGAGSVVTHDIPPYSIAAGSPARVIKKYDHVKHQWVKVERG